MQLVLRSNAASHSLPCPLTPHLGVSLSTVPWVGPGTPSPQSHQITSSCLEASPPSGRRWVSQTLCCIRELKQRRKFQLVLKACCASSRWCLALLREQKRMDALQTQPRAETQVSLPSSPDAAVLWMRLQPNDCLTVAPSVCQAVAHGVFRTRGESVCVWRMCQQSVVSTQSCKTDNRSTCQILFTLNCMMFNLISSFPPTTGAQQRVASFQCPAPVTISVSVESALASFNWFNVCCSA